MHQSTICPGIDTPETPAETLGGVLTDAECDFTSCGSSPLKLGVKLTRYMSRGVVQRHGERRAVANCEILEISSQKPPNVGLIDAE